MKPTSILKITIGGALFVAGTASLAKDIRPADAAIKVGSLNRNFSSFDEAVRALLSVHNWSVIERSRLREGETYAASLRFRLDVASLPKPFQVAALGSRDLDLTTGWTTWALQIPREPR